MLLHLSCPCRDSRGLISSGLYFMKIDGLFPGSSLPGMLCSKVMSLNCACAMCLYPQTMGYMNLGKVQMMYLQ